MQHLIGKNGHIIKATVDEVAAVGKVKELASIPALSYPPILNPPLFKVVMHGFYRLKE